MLKRISKIQNIGRFRNASCGQIQFEKITLIFGRNTYGKSTLGDLFLSIALEDISSLKARKTVPNDGKPQEAIVSFQLDGCSEQPLTINENICNHQIPAPLKLIVFDDGFYHNNVFAARQFTRSTKENFSSFVLGAQGVAKAQEIAEKNKRKRAVTTEKNKLINAAFREIENLDGFIKLIPSNSIEKLREALDNKRKQFNELNKQKNSAKILERKEVSDLKWREDLMGFLDEIDTCFRSSLEIHHQAAREKLAEHIKEHFKNEYGAELWIRQGVEQNLGEICQFCGQTLGEDSLALLKIYEQSFDDSFEKHDKTVKRALTKCRENIFQDRTNEIEIAIERNWTAIISYPELEENIEFRSLNVEIGNLVGDLKQLLGTWESELLNLQAVVDNAIEKKLASPHIALEKIQFDNLSSINNKALSNVVEINEKGKKINIIINEFKKSIQGDTISESLKQFEEEGKKIARNVKRYELSEQCETYKQLITEHKDLSQQIPILQNQLQNEQSEFLNRYFDRLNLHFKEFGSNDFKLEIGENNVGHTPIYYLKVKFRDIDVSESELEKTFSESDRRALSLAIFWARLSGMTDEEKSNAIVVLDDPVTSFDNNRISAVHRKIIELSGEVRQIIILSHFEQEISRFLSTYKNNKKICFLSIVNENGESTLNFENVENFVMSDHEKARENILNFVAGSNSAHNSGDLRIFFEVEISLRFAKQIRDCKINEHNLSDRIDRLLEYGVICETVSQRSHTWREALNPSHHIWMGSDIEDQRNTAKEFVEFVYKELVPATFPH